ncbi:group I intron-associated PD-(D/E)XK endonuclease [Salinibaculum rarum]|uniref:group I intron-associated PD-(D/E)XK endonuclease n=1 Tax=Salinibaculum rarum TaxID=3058903 RepID=UPI00265E9F7A|nr:group I intron-associated PD-(D/E)XK endonuclease [Salinibaculum sp. KK48]
MVENDPHFDKLEETQKRGQATEALLKSEFVLRDIPVLIPEYDNEPYDFVVEIADDFYKIQAKTAYDSPTEGTVMFETVSTRTRSDGYERSGYEGKIDFFAVHNPVLDEYYLVSIEDAATGKMEIRYIEPKNNQRKGINWHEDYLLDTVLANLHPS